MKKAIQSLFIGACAGLLDISPMMLMELPWREVASAFAQWVVLGFVIAHMQLGLPAWLKGALIAVLAAIPILILVSGQGMATLVPIAAMSLILGSLVGWLTDRYAK